MPKMGISVSEGTILEWRKQPGDWVEADETIADVTTDKVDVEIPSPASGRLARIVVEAGETVEVGATIAEIDGGARAGEAHPEESPPVARSGRPPRARPTAPGSISPVVRRIADKHGRRPRAGRGHGHRWPRPQEGRARPRRGGRQRQAKAATRPLHTESPYRPDEPAAAPEPSDETTGDDGERREPMTPMRLAIAKHMVGSRQTAAHCTTIVEVDMSRVAARRAQLKPVFAQRGVALTYLAFVAAATIEALEHHPVLNASVEG